ncbi:MAG TPA: hypothetical protein EYF98_00820 [Planctomycetes bacterium]|nr:hypothetical protein [Planctomycetota bacterium]
MKVHRVKSARPCSSEKEAEKRHAAGVEVEKPYYWWNESRGPGKRYSRYRPKRSQLTRTRWSLVYAIEEALELTSDSLELQNALDSGILVLRKLRWHYLEPAPGRLRTEANFRAKIERIKELIGELGDFLDMDLNQEGVASRPFEEVLQEILDLNWDIPTKAK